MNMDILVADIAYMNVYDFLKDGETKEELLNRANESKKEDIRIWSSHCKKYPDREDLQNFLDNALKKEYQIMTWNEYQKAERYFYINQPMQEIEEEHFYEMLNVLLPKCWCNIRGVEMFCMSEMLTGSYTNQFAKAGDRCYSKIVDITDRETWIHNFL